MVKCPRGTTSQMKANLAYMKRPSVFTFDSNFFSWVYDPIKGQMVYVADKDEVLPESDDMELDSNKADKRCPPTPRDELVYFFVSCFLDILVKRWEGKPCLKAKLGGFQSMGGNESEEFGEDLGPCSPSNPSSTADFLRDLYQKRTSNLSKEKLCCRKESEPSEYEYPAEEDMESGRASDQWRPPMMDEEVQFVLANGVSYNGRVSRRLMEGEGTYVWEDGASYQGEFEGGCITGRGRLEFADLSVYEGGVYNALRHGEGLFCLAESQVMYSGQWWLGKKHGYGLIVYNDPSQGQNYYRGEWQDGMKEGFGFRQYPSGAKYVGFWSKGQRNGKGIMFWSNNDIYRGYWENGVMHGFGEYTWKGFINKTFSYPASNTYRGHWLEGKRNGLGIMELKNGVRIETSWVNNEKDGQGAIVCQNGSVVAANPLFTKDRQSCFKKQEDKVGWLLKEQMRSSRRNDEYLFFYVKNIQRSTVISIPVHSPVHTLSFSTHSRKLFHQHNVIILNELESSKTSTIAVTPEPRSSSYISLDLSIALSDEQYCRLSDCLVQEEKHLRNYIVHKISALTACYNHYASLACDEPGPGQYVLLRIFLWQMFMDAALTSGTTSLVDIDILLAKEDHLLLESTHHPFERLRFWQFLQILITLSWHFYGQYIYGERPLVVEKRLTDFLEYYSHVECKYVLKTAFQYFVELDVFWGRFQDEVPPPAEGSRFEESDMASMEAMYLMYCSVGEPHSARDLVKAICGGNGEVEELSWMQYFEKLSLHKIKSRNALTIAGKLEHVPAPKHFNSPQILDLEGHYVKSTPKAELAIFRNLKPRRLIRCLIQVCPGILSDGFITNMDYQLTFLEFYKAIIQFTETQLKVEAMKKIRGDVIAEYKVQLEEYKKQLSDYEKAKDTSAVSRKKSRQFSDASKKGRK